MKSQKRTLKTVIIDDEFLSVEMIESYVERTENVEIIGKYTDCTQAISILDKNGKNRPELLIIDIQMPMFNGMDFVSEFAPNIPVIFITGHSHHVLKSFRFNVVDFLVKPISFNNFALAINKAKKWQENRTKKTENIKESSFIFIKHNKKNVKIDFNTIVYIEGLKDYIKITTHNETFITYQSLSGIMEYLPADQFARAHKSYIISIANIDYIEAGFIKTKNINIPIGKNYASNINNIINTHFAGRTTRILE